MADDLNFQQISTVNSKLQPQPVTIASTTTIAPTTFYSVISGNTAIATITPPVTGAHLLCMNFTHATPVAFTTSGNVGAVATPTQNLPIFLVYNPITAKYLVGAVS